MDSSIKSTASSSPSCCSVPAGSSSTATKRSAAASSLGTTATTSAAFPLLPDGAVVGLSVLLERLTADVNRFLLLLQPDHLWFHRLLPVVDVGRGTNHPTMLVQRILECTSICHVLRYLLGYDIGV